MGLAHAPQLFHLLEKRFPIVALVDGYRDGVLKALIDMRSV